MKTKNKRRKIDNYFGKKKKLQRKLKLKSHDILN